MKKEQFLISLIKNIKENPTWSGEAIIAITAGVQASAEEIQGKINQVDMILKVISKEEVKRLQNKGFNFTLLK